MKSSICPTCKHDNPGLGEPQVHKAGQCKQCNCGESEICRLTATGVVFHLEHSDNLLSWGMRLSYRMRPFTKFSH
jgi:hypothetical protein